MSPVKRFFLQFLLVYCVFAVPVLIFLGPPGLTAEYLETYKADHERYLDVTKSEAYKLYTERPELHAGDAAFQERVAFVTEYENRSAYRRENRRRSAYDLIFDVLNAASVVVIAVRFGRRPLLNLIDQQITEVRMDIENAEAAREAAREAKAAAEKKTATLDIERETLSTQAGDLVRHELAAIQESADHTVTQLEREAEERRRLHEEQATHQIKRELVEAAVAKAEECLAQTRSDERQALLIDQFLDGIGRAR
jgi:F0F1-type ATP synthase membrane subunit b/b'